MVSSLHVNFILVTGTIASIDFYDEKQVYLEYFHFLKIFKTFAKSTNTIGIRINLVAEGGKPTPSCVIKLICTVNYLLGKIFLNILLKNLVHTPETKINMKSKKNYHHGIFINCSLH